VARLAFGGSAADFVQDNAGNRSAGSVGTVWDSQEDGTRITDLMTVGGNAVTEITSATSPRGLVQFQGPADGTSVVWVDFGAGRVRMVGVTPVVQAVVHGADASVARPNGASMVIWYGSVQPTHVAAPDLVVRTDEAS
jgi:hypothetical protein